MDSLGFGSNGKSSPDPDACEKRCIAMWRSAFPISEWLPRYRWRDDFVADFMAGLTVAVMHIPQGMAYAMLASVEPIVGLYTSFFPVLVYILMGTSPHSSFGEEHSCHSLSGSQAFNGINLLGTFAVASILISKPVEELSKGTGEEDNHETHNPVEVATTLAFLIGLLQVRDLTRSLRLLNRISRIIN